MRPLFLYLWLVLGFLFALAFALLPYFMDHIWNVWQVIAGILLVAAQVLSVSFLHRKKAIGIGILAVGNLIFITQAFQTLANTRNLWPSKQIMEIAANAPLISCGYSSPSLVFLNGTQTLLTNDATFTAAWMEQHPYSMGILDERYAPSVFSCFQQSDCSLKTVGLLPGGVFSPLQVIKLKD